MTDATNTLEHLAPCPFCLGKAELEEIDLPLGTGYYVACTQCDGQMGDTDDTWNSPEYAIRKWNIRRAPQPAQAQATAKQQYLAGAGQLIVSHTEWNQRYVDGWNDGNNDAKQSEEQVCDVCEGDGELEDHSHLSPPVYGDWPMITCWKCNGTGIKPQPAQAQAADIPKDDIGLCAAAVVLAWHRKTHDHILADDDTINAAWRVEKWLGRR